MQKKPAAGVQPKTIHWNSWLRLALCIVKEPDGCQEDAVFEHVDHGFLPDGRGEMKAWPGCGSDYVGVCQRCWFALLAPIFITRALHLTCVHTSGIFRWWCLPKTQVCIPFQIEFSDGVLLWDGCMVLRNPSRVYCVFSQFIFQMI